MKIVVAYSNKENKSLQILCCSTAPQSYFFERGIVINVKVKVLLLAKKTAA
jgi:hypothetical protein